MTPNANITANSEQTTVLNSALFFIASPHQLVVISPVYPSPQQSSTIKYEEPHPDIWGKTTEREKKPGFGPGVITKREFF
jgi:hypothetical protein